MEIKEILKQIEYSNVKNETNFVVEGLSCNSKDKNLDGIYFCLIGLNKDGHNYANEAIKNGAKCLVVEKVLDVPVMQIVVQNSRKAMTKIASIFYGINSSKLKIIGITGTNGKTTTSFLTKSYLTKLNKSVGLIGTEGIYFNSLLLPTKLTTPDPIDLYKILHEMEISGIEYVVMEVSAHAIALNKIDGINFEIVALTNITQDHLDFFKTMDNYARAKSELFSTNHSKKAVINIDDDYCVNIAKKTNCQLSTVSLYNNADLSLSDCNCQINKTFATFNFENQLFNLETNLIGRYNVANTMLAMAIVKSLGFDYGEIIKVVNETESFVPGRFNVLNTPSEYTVIVDFAHTPDGMEKILKTCKELNVAKIICVFGCGGDRDKSKRKIMGEIGEKFADFCVVTSDNPRTENPNLIIKDITENMKKHFIEICDRRLAIKYALDLAQKDDLVLILGKGAENYQEINHVKYAYCDYDVVDNYFKDLMLQNVNLKKVKKI